jgi:hypothetical protein
MPTRRPGRPAGPKKAAFRLRLYREQMRDLKILHHVLDGEPPINGLIQTAVQRYIELKLKNPRVRAAYEAQVSPRLKVVS